MVLSDRDMKYYLKRGDIGIDPLQFNCIQPASIDLHMGEDTIVFRGIQPELIDLTTGDKLIPGYLQGKLAIKPGEFCLISTQERIRVPNFMAARLEGKSGLGRLGLLVHSTAGFVDPGWDGVLTLEITNVSPAVWTLHPGMAIAQISFLLLSSPAERPYGSPGLQSKYQGASSVKESKYQL